MASLTTLVMIAALAFPSGRNALALGFPARRSPVPRFAPPRLLPATRFDRGRTLPRLATSLFLTPNKDEFDGEDDDDVQGRPREADAPDDDPPTISSNLESLESSGSFLSNIKGVFNRKKKFDRESLSKLGMSALLAYGFVSNVSGVIAVSCAWFVFSKRTGISPLANKPAFLALYAGFTVVLNVIRPARFALSVAISPYFERVRNYVQKRFGVGPRGATALVVLFVNLVGTCSLMAAGVGLASVLSGVPVWGGMR